jgi:hypothetical protein
VKELRAARGLVTPDGIVLIGVPNLGGVSARIKSLQSRLGLKRHRWRHYAAIHHVWFFTPRTLALVARAAGLVIVRWETPAIAGRPATTVARAILERVRLGSILDAYCRRA